MMKIKKACWAMRFYKLRQTGGFNPFDRVVLVIYWNAISTTWYKLVAGVPFSIYHSTDGLMFHENHKERGNDVPCLV